MKIKEIKNNKLFDLFISWILGIVIITGILTYIFGLVLGFIGTLIGSFIGFYLTIKIFKPKL